MGKIFGEECERKFNIYNLIIYIFYIKVNRLQIYFATKLCVRNLSIRKYISLNISCK